MMTIEDLKEKIGKLEKLINSGALSKEESDSMQSALDIANAKLEKELEIEKTKAVNEPVAVEKTKTKSSGAKKVAKATTRKTVAKAPVKKEVTKPVEKSTPKKRSKPSKMITMNGVEYVSGSSEHCEALMAAFVERRKKAKSTNKKTKSVMESIADKVASSVSKVVSKSVSKNKEDFQKNPAKYMKMYHKLEDSSEKFLTSLKEVMGDDFDSSEIKDAVENIKHSIEELKNKFTPKK